MAPWRSGYAEVCKTSYTGSIPVGASRIVGSRHVVFEWPQNMGEWRNGIRGGLKIRWPKGLEGSSPSLPTRYYIKVSIVIKHDSPGDAASG